MKTYMFPGQGSQSVGMGADLFDGYPELCEQADAILGFSIRELCTKDPRGELSKTQFTQPALYMVNAMSYLRTVQQQGAPDFLVGHSLGELNALMAAGCFDFETGLKLVQKRGELMSRVSGGGMAAIVNTSRDQIADILNTAGLDKVCMANFNAPMQTVISGPSEQIAAAEPLFQRKGNIRYYPLATSGAFHSVYMNDAMEQFRAYLQGFHFAAPRIPVIANATAKPYESNALLATLASQIANTVRWSDSIQYLLALAAGRGEEAQFVECGHGDVLTRMIYTIRSQTTPDDLARVLAAAAAVSAPDDEARAAIVDTPQAASVDVHAKVEAWKKRYPVGSRMKSTMGGYDDLETRTEPVVLFGHRAAVYMKGYAGYFDLDELTPA